MKKYDSYKDSGVKGLGEIPSTWQLKKFKYCCDFFGRIGFRGYTQADLVSKGEGAITLSPTNMNFYNVDFSKCSYLSWRKYNESPEIMVKPGDVLLVKTASVGKCSYVDHIPLECTVNPQILVLKNHKENAKFVTYLLRSDVGQSYLDRYKGGSTIYTISEEKIGNFIFAFPSIAEQTQIVSYLDEKCGKIDALIEAKEKQITDMLDYRRAIISETVTRGLNPDAPLKDSGIKWIGKIPTHWDVIKLGYLFEHNTGKALNSSNTEGEIFPYLTTSNVYWDKFELSTVKEMYFTKDELDKCTVRKGDLLVCEGGDIGRAAIWNKDYEICIQNHLHRLRAKTDNICTKYFYYHLFYNKVSGAIDLQGNGVGILGLSSNQLHSLIFAFPPLAEQEAIAEYLDEKCGKIDAVVEQLQGQIADLKDLKAATISDAVTGKVDVRDWK